LVVKIYRWVLHLICFIMIFNTYSFAQSTSFSGLQPCLNTLHYTSNEVICSVKMSNANGLDVSTIQYRISNTGSTGYGAWTDAGVTYFGGGTSVYALVSISNFFTDGIDNWIQWKVTDMGTTPSTDYSSEINFEGKSVNTFSSGRLIFEDMYAGQTNKYLDIEFVPNVDIPPTAIISVEFLDYFDVAGCNTYVSGNLGGTPAVTNYVSGYAIIEIDRNSTGLTLGAGSKVYFRISSIDMPGTSGFYGRGKIVVYQDNTYNTILGIVEDVFLGAVYQEALSNADVQPASLNAGDTGDVTVQFTTYYLPAAGRIIVWLPEGFSANPSLTAIQNVSGMDGGFNLLIRNGVKGTNNIIEVIRDGTGTDIIDTPTSISFVLTNITNPPTPGETKDYRIFTFCDAFSLIGAANRIPGDTITSSSATAPKAKLFLAYQPTLPYDGNSPFVKITLIPDQPLLETPTVEFEYNDPVSGLTNVPLTLTDIGNASIDCWYTTMEPTYLVSDLEFTVSMKGTNGLVGSEIVEPQNGIFKFSNPTRQLPANEWIIFGYPGLRKTYLVEEIFNFDSTTNPFVIYELLNSPTYQYQQKTPRCDMISGRGYWLLCNSPIDINPYAIYPAPINEVSECVVAANSSTPDADVIENVSTLQELSSGWNMLANPYSFNIPVKAILIDNGNEPMTMLNILDSNSVENKLWGYKDLAGGYYLLNSEADIIETGRGVFVYSLTPEVGIAFAPMDTSTVTKATISNKALARVVDYIDTGVGMDIYYKMKYKPQRVIPVSIGKTEGLNWQIRIMATSGSLIDAHTYIGMSDLASDSYDRFDAHKPLALPGMLACYIISDKGERLGVDIRNSASVNTEWHLRIYSKEKNQEVSVTFDGLSELPEKYYLLVEDEEKDVTYKLLRKNSILLRTNEEKVADFNIRLLEKDFGITATTGDYSVVAYPNPVTSGDLTIRYNIADDTYVTAKVYDAQGKKVKILENDSLKTLPKCESIWDLTRADGREVSNGIYFIFVKLRRASDNVEFNHTIKVAVLR